MDLDRIIRELLDEHKKIHELIQSLEGTGPSGGWSAPPRTKRGRKFMDTAGRLEVSERMKRYWAKRRGDGSSGPSAAERARPVAA